MRCDGPFLIGPLIGVKPFLLGRSVTNSDVSSFPIRIFCDVLRSGLRFDGDGDNDGGAGAMPIDCFRLKTSASSTWFTLGGVRYESKCGKAGRFFALLLRLSGRCFFAFGRLLVVKIEPFESPDKSSLSLSL